ncbi:MAG: GGDEF domain-containing protein [Thermoanaerobaculaceae bacterium]
MLRGAIRVTDTVGRLGGEEFMLLFPNTDLEKSTLVAEKVRACVEAVLVKWREEELQVTVTVGVSAAEQQTPAEAMRRAEKLSRSQSFAVARCRFNTGAPALASSPMPSSPSL